MTDPQVPSPAPGAAGAATTTMAQAVEAGAQGVCRHIGLTWEHLNERAQMAYRAEAEACIEAVLPLLLAAVDTEEPTEGPWRVTGYPSDESARNVRNIETGDTFMNLPSGEAVAVCAALNRVATRVLLAAQPPQQQQQPQGKKEGEG